jgi:hypothetical protein
MALAMALVLLVPGQASFAATPARAVALSGADASAPLAGLVRPSVEAVRIEASEAPMIDGNLSEPVWGRAAVIDKFTQKGPNPGEPATERTVVRILYDQSNLYISFYAYDSAPDDIIPGSLERDGRLSAADSVAIYIDPGRTRRNAYNFEVGAAGGRTDQLELNNTQELRDWDTIWTGRAVRVADGYTVEVAIPFASLSYDPTQTVWGFDVGRRIRHKNERIYWSGWAPTLDFTDVSQSGDLSGIGGVNQGLGLDVQVYGTLRAKHDWSKTADGAGISFTGGGNIFYKVTPALTNTFTVNPDFSDAPLDIRQVNTTRFSLFTPETRDFFLQDVAAFEFGGHNFARNTQDRASNNARPFFSRNIGLAQGTPVSLVVGDKVSGELAGFDIGALSVLTDRTPTSPGQVLSVTRVTHPVLAESKLGFILTNGDPTGLTRNSLAGVDFQYRNSDFLGGNVVQADMYYQRSFSSSKGDDDSSAFSVSYPNEPWGGDFVYKQVGQNFTPALGFVNRTGIRQYDGTVSHLTRFRNMNLNQFEIDTDYEFITNVQHRLESRFNDVAVRAASRIGDEIFFKVINSFENVPKAFTLPKNVPIFPGRYDWTNFDVRVRTFDGRPLSIDAEINCCRFYNGRAIDAKIRVNYRPNAYFEFVPSYQGTFIDLPTGHVDVHLVALDSVINFVPDMNVAIQAQYDNISQRVGLSVRYRWEYQPGNEIFVGFGQSALIPGTTFRAQVSQFSLRLGHTFRF